MKKILVILFLSTLIWQGCEVQTEVKNDNVPTLSQYFDQRGRDDILSGGVKMIPISTPDGVFHVWTKRIGNNPKIKVLLLHGGPGYTHEYLECFDSFFPKEGIEYYYYDQLGSTYSDQPPMQNLLGIDRFVDEVEQVRQALDLDSSNFYLFGHSWGGALALEYALKYQKNLKGLIISDMMSSVPEYNRYAEVLKKQMDPEALAEINAIEEKKDYGNPRYEELLMTNYYVYHLCRLSPENWPEPLIRSSKHLNPGVYIPIQGPSEMGIAKDALLYHWDRSKDLPKIGVPTLCVGARYDTMDPEYMKWMATQFPDGHYLYCPNGSHLCMYDDQKTYFKGLVDFIHEVNEKK